MCCYQFLLAAFYFWWYILSLQTLQGEKRPITMAVAPLAALLVRTLGSFDFEYNILKMKVTSFVSKC